VITIGELPTLTAKSGYEFDRWDTDPTGETVTDNVTYKAIFKKATYNVTASGLTGVATKATYDTDFTFTPTAEGKLVTNVRYTVAGDNTQYTATKNPNGSYTIDGKTITGNLTIQADTVSGTIQTIDYNTYKALATGTKIIIIEADKLSGQSYTLGNGYGTIYWSDKYNGYVAIVNSDVTDAQLAASLSIANGGATDVNYDGDVNGYSGTTAADSGIINDILHHVTLHYVPHDLMRLRLDVDGSKTVDVQDITKTLNLSVGLGN
jgi:hypothetical protein